MNKDSHNDTSMVAIQNHDRRRSHRSRYTSDDACRRRWFGGGDIGRESRREKDYINVEEE